MVPWRFPCCRQMIGAAHSMLRDTRGHSQSCLNANRNAGANENQFLVNIVVRGHENAPRRGCYRTPVNLGCHRRCLSPPENIPLPSWRRYPATNRAAIQRGGASIPKGVAANTCFEKKPGPCRGSRGQIPKPGLHANTDTRQTGADALTREPGRAKSEHSGSGAIGHWETLFPETPGGG